MAKSENWNEPQAKLSQNRFVLYIGLFINDISSLALSMNSSPSSLLEVLQLYTNAQKSWITWWSQQFFPALNTVDYQFISYWPSEIRKKHYKQIQLLQAHLYSYGSSFSYGLLGLLQLICMISDSKICAHNQC